MKMLLRLVAVVTLMGAGIGQGQVHAPDHLPSRLQKISAQGSGEAAYHLGMLYHLGLEGAPKDPRKAFELFKLAAGRGDPLGAYKLGCYYDGQGGGIVKDDAVLAERHKRVAAEAGYALAQRDLAGLLFAKGEVAQALLWLEAAAAQGDLEALMVAAGLFSGEDPRVSRDAVKSYAYVLVFGGKMSGAKLTPDILAQARAELGTKMTADELRRAEAMASEWRDRPTPVTEKASAGLDAARKLIAMTGHSPKG